MWPLWTERRSEWQRWTGRPDQLQVLSVLTGGSRRWEARSPGFRQTQGCTLCCIIRASALSRPVCQREGFSCGVGRTEDGGRLFVEDSADASHGFFWHSVRTVWRTTSLRPGRERGREIFFKGEGYWGIWGVG